MNRFYSLLMAACLIALVQGCGNAHNGTATAPAQKTLTLGFVCNNPSPYWSIVRVGCDHALGHLDANVKLDFREPMSATVTEQEEIVSNLLASGVDGIAISPIDPDRQTGFLNYVASRTLLVCMDADAGKSKRVCYIGSDNNAAGVQAAELLKAALPQGGKVALFVGYSNAQNAKDRIQSITNTLAGSNIRIVDTLLDKSKGLLAEKNALDELKKYPDLAGMVGLYSYDGPALLMAARIAGKVGKVKIVCFDEESDTLRGVVDGGIYGTVVQSPYSIGFETTVRMAKYLRGDKTQLAGGKIFTPTTKITRANVLYLEGQLRNQLDESEALK